MKRPAPLLAVSLAISAAIHAGVLIAFYLAPPRLEDPIRAGSAVPRIRLLIQTPPPPSDIEKIPKPQPSQTSDAPRATKRENSQETAALPLNSGRFYHVAELDAFPTMRGEIDPDPQELRGLPDSGDVALKLFLDRQGNVIQVQLQRSDLPEQFVRYATDSFSKAKFSPGTIKNIPVPVELHVVLHFDPATQ